MIIEKRDYYNHGAIEAIDAIESACAGLSLTNCTYPIYDIVFSLPTT